MSPLWRRELRVGLCPHRLVTPQGVKSVEDDASAELRELGKRSPLFVVLSNHFVRYTVLPHKKALRSSADWHAYAGHTFEFTYGSIATEWQIAVSPAPSGEPRVACAVDAALVDSLRSIRAVVSIQPYFVAAFNARRRTLGQEGWFVLQEPERLALGLISKGTWQRIRVRHVSSDWASVCADLLEREFSLWAGDECSVAFVCAEDEPPHQLGRFRVIDVTALKRKAGYERDRTMALH